MTTRPVFAACVAFALAASSFAQTISFPDFSSTAGLVLNGNAVQNGSALRLVPSVLSQKGTVWFATPLPVVGGFDTTFTFQTSVPSGGGADGFTFAIHNDPRGTTLLTNHAAALGYGAFATSPAGTAMSNGLVVEFDTFQSSFGGYSDLSGNEISVHTGGTGENSHGEGFSIGRVSPAVNFSNAAVHTARVQYVPGTIKVYLDNLTTPVLTAPYTFAGGGTHVLPATPVGGLSLLPGGYAYVGFTASTGGSFENYDLLSWTYDPSFLLTATTSGGGVGDLLLSLDVIPPATTEGFTLVTFDTTGAIGTGPAFGIWPDPTTYAILQEPGFAGNPLHWTTGTPGLFPATPLYVSPGTLSFLSGQSWRLVAVAFAPSFTYVKHTNVVQVDW
jgi:hypothetical protein